jgi:hypothetical protein
MVVYRFWRLFVHYETLILEDVVRGQEMLDKSGHETAVRDDLDRAVAARTHPGRQLLQALLADDVAALERHRPPIRAGHHAAADGTFAEAAEFVVRVNWGAVRQAFRHDLALSAVTTGIVFDWRNCVGIGMDQLERTACRSLAGGRTPVDDQGDVPGFIVGTKAKICGIWATVGSAGRRWRCFIECVQNIGSGRGVR